ncbi:MAG: HIT family protein [Nanoarchaeota archaeon]|nr:HIT family protein [Nanoarchaeota archaeon]MBU4456192.1 HIT family protein [Nanoarchaeota archaeon]MCG2719946.1 HIT family protein [Nanoarchaeota archaeon]
MDDCIFCKIVKGEIPCSKVYEDNHVIAFLDIAPASKGHTLIVPKEHYEIIPNVPNALLEKTIDVVKKIGCALLKENDGFNVMQNNRKAAEQLVPHVHFHVIPRNNGDGLDVAKWKSSKYAEGEMEEMLAKLKDNMR